jgi:hypothetical protein
MTTSAITFDQMEREADRTFALALWAKHASLFGQVVMLLTLVSWALRGLVRSLSSTDRLNSLTTEHAVELTKRLQETHEVLTQLSRMTDIHRLTERPVVGPLLRSVQDSTEDLGDIIEDLLLSENKEFRRLVASSVQTLSQHPPAETIGRM